MEKKGEVKPPLSFQHKEVNSVNVLMDALGELGSQAASGITKVILAGLGVIVVLAGALIVQVRKNKKE